MRYPTRFRKKSEVKPGGSNKPPTTTDADTSAEVAGDVKPGGADWPKTP